MSIKNWPVEERPREKLLLKGAASLSDAELLAIFLRTGIKGKSAVELARELLHAFGGLRPLLTASQRKFCSHLGLGVAKYTQLQAVLEMSGRYLEAQLMKGDRLNSPEAAGKFLQLQMRDLPHEVFSLLLLDTQHRVIHYEELFKGTLNAASIYPREVIKLVLEHNAASVILAHNHPSGVAEPSPADEAITKKLVRALRSVEIDVLDHLVIGEGEPVSFVSRGLL